MEFSGTIMTKIHISGRTMKNDEDTRDSDYCNVAESEFQLSVIRDGMQQMLSLVFFQNARFELFLDKTNGHYDVKFYHKNIAHSFPFMILI